MLPTGNIARIIDRWNCWSKKRTRDDNHLLNGSRNWTGGDKLLSGGDYELQTNMITWVIVRNATRRANRIARLLREYRWGY